MTRDEQLRFLIGRLLDELPQYRAQATQFPADAPAQRRLLRSLMNVRPPLPLAPDFLAGIRKALAGGFAARVSDTEKKLRELGVEP